MFYKQKKIIDTSTPTLPHHYTIQLQYSTHMIAVLVVRHVGITSYNHGRSTKCGADRARSRGCVTSATTAQLTTAVSACVLQTPKT